jgi:ESS family glutamate:Na+ symporter
MTLFDVLLAFAALSLLLLLATALCRRVRLLQRLGLPEALIAGLLGLAIGPFSPLGIFPESITTVWSQTPGALICLVFATLFLGRALPSPQLLWRRAASQIAFGMVLGLGQYLIGGLAVLLVLQPLLGVNPLMACLIEVGFEGGHGTAAGMGPSFARLGLASGEALGLAMATVGVLAGVLVGGALIVIGRRRRWLISVGAADPFLEPVPAALLPPGPSPTIDALTVNLALIGAAVGLGVLIREALVRGWPVLEALPLFPLAMIGGLLVQLVLARSGNGDLADERLQRTIGALAMDLLITAAMASLNLPLLEEFWLPFSLLAVLGLAWIVAVFWWLAPRLFTDAWFERGLADLGQSMGMTATGLLLLRMADPYGRSQSLEAFSLKQLAFEPFLGGGLLTAFAPIALVSLGLPTWTALAGALTAASLGFGLAVRRSP